MNNAKLQLAKDIYAALGRYIQSFEELPMIAPEVKEEPEKPVAQEENTPVEKTADKPKGASKYTREELESMGYNGMKSLAKTLGLTAKGDRESLINMILEATSKTVKEGPMEEEKPLAQEPVQDNSSIKEEPEEEESDNLEAQVIEATEEMSDGELLEFLLSYGIKAKGKRQALIAAAVKGVRDGLIALEDDDEETSEETAADDATEEEPEELDYDKINDPNGEGVTEERAASIEAMNSDIDAQYKKGELKRADIIAFINDYFGDDNNRHKDMAENVLLKLYKNLACLFINDEGEVPNDEAESEVYTVNGDAYCCGHPCAWDEDAETYICQKCGGEYKADEE